MTSNDIIEKAVRVLEERMQYGVSLTVSSPDDMKNFCRLKLAGLEHEVFGVLFLDNRHRLINYVEMFRGTIDQSNVYPREVAKEALKQNAAAVIFTHNHPSGVTEPSMSDRRITTKLREALALFDIRTLDHIVVGQGEPYSFVERGDLQ